MSELKLPCDVGEVSDGYHTFNELYEHRCLLFIALMRAHPELGWRAVTHDDGSRFDGWFVAGMHLPTGDITYHLPERMWEKLDRCSILTLQKAPKWDGHDSGDVLDRLMLWIMRDAQPNHTDMV